MRTEILPDSPDGIIKAGEIIKNGGLVAFPTETVYGLGANAFDGKACLKIYEAKGRAADNPLIVHISKPEQLAALVTDIPEKAQILADNFWAGPLTLILNKSPLVPDEVTCGMPTVAVRLPSHPTARALIDTAGVPIAAPSANLSGSPSPVTAQHCISDLSGRVDAIINGDNCECGVESTIMLMTSNPPTLLRPGFVTVEQIEAVIGKIKIDEAVLNPLNDGRKVLSPGLKYKHYSPKARVVIVEGDGFCEYVNAKADKSDVALCFDEDEKSLDIRCLCCGHADDADTQAHNLFGCLRLADEMNAKTVYARCPDSKGVGLAVLNRLLRAAGFEKITL